jgi:macrolide transport system ATP-binding/permease protein
MPGHDFVALRDVQFAHDSAAPALLSGLSLQLPRGWTGIVGPNGSGKTTLLRLIAGEISPQQGAVHAPDAVFLCAQRTDDPPAGLEDLLAAHGAHAASLRHGLGIDDGWPARWPTLSFGERKRAQLAVALWQEPAVLAVDEPTNHIDADARRLLLRALRGFRGVGLLVSHDRELLDALCQRCLFLDPPDATLRPGGYSEAAAQAAQERETALATRRLAHRERDRLEREAARRREEAERSDRRRSKRGLSRHDHDTRARIDLARVSGKDGQAGRFLRQLDGRLGRAEDLAAAQRVRKQYELGIWIEGARSRRDALLRIAAGPIALGPGRALHVPELSMRPDDRIALTGPNGAGKSSLVRALLARVNVEAERLVFIPQEIAAREAAAILDQARRLDRLALGRVMTAVSCLGSRPERLLATPEPSPGELRKLLLALGLARTPHLIVMDEPTNHLDLPSIESLEEALEGCPCGMLLVSHDRPFLARLAQIEWRIVGNGGDSRLDPQPIGNDRAGSLR